MQREADPTASHSASAQLSQHPWRMDSCRYCHGRLQPRRMGGYPVCARSEGRRGARGETGKGCCVCLCQFGDEFLSFFYFFCMCASPPPASLRLHSCHLWHGLFFGRTSAAPVAPGAALRLPICCAVAVETEHARLLNYIIELEYTETKQVLCVQEDWTSVRRCTV